MRLEVVVFKAFKRGVRYFVESPFVNMFTIVALLLYGIVRM